MKIYIIGPSGSGKTYLADQLSQKLAIKHTNLDYFFYKHVKDKSREEVPELEWKENLKRLLETENWVIEGVNPITEVFDVADKIIFLNPPITTALFRQWKRYLTDPIQRKQHGFKNNIKLSRYLIKQYLEKGDPEKSDDPKYSRVKKITRILEKYSNKVLILNSPEEVKRFLDSYAETQ